MRQIFLITIFIVAVGSSIAVRTRWVKMCRELKQGTLRVYRAGKIAFVVPNIAARAKLSLSESKNLRYVKYMPNPFAKKKIDNPP